MLSQKLFNKIFSTYNIKNKSIFITNFLTNYVCMHNNVIKEEEGYEYILAYYLELLKTLPPSLIKSALYNFILSKKTSSPINLQFIQILNSSELIDTIEYILSLEQEITIQLISQYPFEVTTDVYGNVYVNGVTGNNFKIILRKLLASIIYSLNNINDDLNQYNTYTLYPYSMYEYFVEYTL